MYNQEEYKYRLIYSKIYISPEIYAHPKGSFLFCIQGVFFVSCRTGDRGKAGWQNYLIARLATVEGVNRRYVTLDAPLILALAKEDPVLFMQRFPAPVLIDEIQYAPELLPHIKMPIDQNRTPGMLWLTGSQQFHLMQGVSESLAGRIAIVRLFGFSFREKEGTVTHFPFMLTKEIPVSGKSPLTLPELFCEIWGGSSRLLQGKP